MIERIKQKISESKEACNYNPLTRVIPVADILEIMEQEAKKVIEKYKAKAQEDIEAYGEDAVFGYCPVCGGLQNTVWNTKYCGDCGQRLDWSDEE